VKREVFEKIAETKEDPFAIRGPGEDVSFCQRAKALGYKIFVDTTVEIGHVGEVVVGPDFARRNRDFVMFPWVDPAKRPPPVESASPLPPQRLRGDEITLDARLARSRYAMAGKVISSHVRVGEVLDFGCGTGYGCPILAREALIRGSNVLVGGYDIDPIAVAFGRESFWPRLTAEWEEARSDELAAITCFNVIQHTAMWRSDLAAAERASLLRTLIGAAPLVIGSLPYPEYTPDDLDLPGSVTVSYLGQRSDSTFGPLDDRAQDMIFVISR
jgi:SAM-dependent methyltransferase